MNHIFFHYDYLIEDKSINVKMIIGPDEYIKQKISLQFHDGTRLNQIIKIYDKIKNLLNSNKFIIKNFMFIFEDSDFSLTYKFTNNNNNLKLSLFNGDIWLYSIDLVSRIPKNENTVEIDNLATMMFKSNI
jgi:hypothetical protein